MNTDDMELKNKSRRLHAVLVLVGAASVGKSETLSALGDTLRERARFFYEQKCQSESHDRKMLLKYGRRIIGICTAGDTEDIIKANLKFVGKGCDIAILAARVEGNTDMGTIIKKTISKHKSKPKVWFCTFEKRDATTLYSRKLAQIACIEHFVRTIECSGIKALKKTFENC